MHYLMIFEDGTVWRSNEITSNDAQGLELGILRIFDISDPANPKEADFEDAWTSIPTWKEYEESLT